VTRLLEVFVAGDDAAKGVVAQLATDGGSTSARWGSRTSSRASAT
jgi:predicted dinucleotide-binding enzyme